ncbi:YgiT-type zinc finger protein [Candidatus Poribacteria bacterium]|nr:YgiT-type zinc finger protein [Candidatus Poribacteria bacterium]
MEKIPKCYKCGKLMKEAILREHVVTTLNGHTIVCLDVPIHRCIDCGEVYFSSTVAEMFDDIRRGLLSPDKTAVVELPALSVQQRLTATA